MLSTLAVILITFGASIVFFLVVSAPTVLLLRAYDRRRRNEQETTRDISAVQRVRLSVGSSNYSHVPEPRTNLRRSAHLPYGVVSEGWASIPSQERLANYSRPAIRAPPVTVESTSRQKRRRSLRASFSAHSFSIPKTRRQKKIEKTIPLRAMPRSPLSAITEHSGTNTTEASPAIGIAELPTEVPPRTTPEKEDDAVTVVRPPSAQWPLPPSKRASFSGAQTIIPVPASRNSTLMRMDSTGHSVSSARPSLGQRSLSVTSTLSTAPDDPLPPLPSIVAHQWSNGRRSRLRLSAASVETIGSSVLGAERSSPSHIDTDLTSIGSASTPIDLNPTGLKAYDRESETWEPAAVITTGSPRAKHRTQYRRGKAGLGSFRASISPYSAQQNATDDHAPMSDRSSLIPRPTGSALTTIDASHWRSTLSRRPISTTSLSLANNQTGARTGSGYKRGTVAARHSMYEQHSTTAAHPSVLRDVSGNPAGPIRRHTSSRPASIASESPFHWDRASLQTGLPSSLKQSPASQRKGHKRQNCVRISNLPAVDNRRGSKLPQMAEEEEDWLETATSNKTLIPGLTLLERQEQAYDGDPRSKEVDVSPFRSRPVLNPTTQKRPQYSRAFSSESTISRQRESDVFSNSRYDPNAPNIFSETSTPQRQWPLSPTPQYRARPQPTPPALKAIQGPYDPDSPTLPSPAVSSASLFARKLPFGSRTPGIQGPRELPRCSHTSRAASPSPVAGRSTAKREDLRRSVITLRRMNSDAKDKTRMSQIYRNIGEEDSSSSTNENRMGEEKPRTQSAASVTSIGMALKGPSTTNINLQVPDAHLSIPPSASIALMSGNLRFSKSRSRIAPSPSIMSTGATSIWEDASVRGDSPEPELPIPSKIPLSQAVDVDAYENFIGQIQDKRSQKDRDRESRLTSPQGKGLGLTGVQFNGKAWGTPGSLYDREGFLKE
jgi:hypothetical protein